MLLLFKYRAFIQKIETKRKNNGARPYNYFKDIERLNCTFLFLKNYSTKDSISYPVLICFDGQYFFPVIRGARTIFD
jgi:hypothetical protein